MPPQPATRPAATGASEDLIAYVTDRPGHDRRYSLSSDKVRALGWEPQMRFEEGLEHTVAWYRENTVWWEPIRSGDYRAYYDRKFAELWEDIEEMMPAARGALWKKPHLVTTYGVICKPGQVGAARPDTLVRGVEGLYLTGDTTRARGIGVDKAARSGLTTAEAVLGRRLDFFADSVRY